MRLVLVTWLDGSQEAYLAESGDVAVRDGQLVLTARNEAGGRETYSIPLVNVRVWKMELP